MSCDYRRINFLLLKREPGKYALSKLKDGSDKAIEAE